MIFYSNLPKTEQKNKVKFVKCQFSKNQAPIYKLVPDFTLENCNNIFWWQLTCTLFLTFNLWYVQVFVFFKIR